MKWGVMEVVVCISLLEVHWRLYAVVVYFQLDVKKGQFEVTDVGCELERWMKIWDVIDEILQFNTTTLCSSDYVINVALV